MRADWFEDDGFWLAFEGILFSPERLANTSAEVDGVLELMRPEAGARFLDLACGPGRHALELARRGHPVTGVDRTRPYLERLRQSAEAESLDVEIVNRDMRLFRRPAAYDAAICYFTSFGYFRDPTDDLRVATNVYDSLSSGGRFLVDVLGKEVLARGYLERWWKWLEPDLLLLEEREVQEAWSRLYTRWTLLRGAERKSYTMVNRIYSGTELSALLRQAGFDHVRLFGTPRGGPYDRTSWRLIAVAEKD